MTKDEALDLALEALEKLWLLGDQAGAIANPAITAIKQALAAPTVQEPYGYVWFTKHMEHRFTRMKPHPDMGAMDIKPIYTTPPAAPVQETVAFFDWYDNAHWGNEDFKEGCHRSWNAAIKYTTPPNVATPLAAQRQWVGLTDEEITDIWAESSPYYHEDDFARAIEAKLKEKNNG
jgi:hypothetical protein